MSNQNPTIQAACAAFGIPQAELEVETVKIARASSGMYASIRPSGGDLCVLLTPRMPMQESLRRTAQEDLDRARRLLVRAARQARAADMIEAEERALA